MKSRVIKYLLTGTAFLALGLLWAFSYFFFNPFEGSYAGDLSMLVPRDVDFFLAKKNVRDLFDPVPRPAALDELEADPAGRVLLELEGVAAVLEDIDLEGIRATIDESLAQLPIAVDPLDVYGGRDLAIAGYFQPGGGLDWGIYGRANWLGKLGVEAVRKDLVGLASQGITLETRERGYTLSGGSLVQPVHVTRFEDVVILTTRAELIDQAHALSQIRGQDSFGLSAKYQNHLDALTIDGDELNVYFNQKSWFDATGETGSWPDTHAPEVASRMLGRLFRLGLVREHVATITFDNGVAFDLTGAVSSENLTQVQRKLYRMRGMEKADVLEFAKLAPDDVGLFVCGQGPMNELLTELTPALEPAMFELFEDMARDVFGYADAHPLLGDISASFGDRFALFVRDYDYPKDAAEDAPPSDGTPCAAWALVFPLEDEASYDRLYEHVRANPGAFAIQGRNPAKGGIFTNTVAGGFTVTEFHSALVPGTGHLATLKIHGGRQKYFLLSNSYQLLGDASTAYREQRTRLAEDNWFETLVNTGLGSVDVALWFNPREIADTMREIATQNAKFDIMLAIDWDRERARIEDLVIKEHFPGERRGSVSVENEDAVNLLVDEKVDEFEREFVLGQLPTLEREYARPWDAAELTSGIFLQLSLDQKEYRLHGRVVIPFDGEERRAANTVEG